VVTDEFATVQVRVNGGSYASVTSGSPSAALPLDAGANTVEVLVTAQDGSTTKTYTIGVFRTPSTNANLTAMSFSFGTLNPGFSSGTTTYTTSVANLENPVTVTSTREDPYSTIEVRLNGGGWAAVTSGNPSGPLSLNVGPNTVDVRVTAQDGSTEKTYTTTVTRAPSDNADLSALALSSGSLNPSFDSATSDYTAGVGNSITNITVTPTASEPNATITVNGNPVTSGNASSPIPLVLGPNTITIVTLAQNGSATKTYTVVVTRSSVIVADQADTGIENDLLVQDLNVTGTPIGALVYAVTTPTTNGTVTLDQATGSYRYRPNANFIGTDKFTYTVADDSGHLGTATVLIQIVRRPPNWTWESGPSLAKQKGTYPAGNPGARGGMASWSDGSSTMWVFGGTGFGATTGPGALNDLWSVNLATETWTHLKGSNAINTPGIYGTKGVSAPANTPGARAGATTWRDAQGNLWLFGGTGKDGATGTGVLNDLWKYDTGTGEWTWISGDSIVKVNGVYGTAGVPAAVNKPGARSGAVGWTDCEGRRLYLFGGNGVPETGTALGLLNDVWMFDTVTEQWTWLKGSKLIKALGAYGTKGIASSANTPGARLDATTWVGRDGMFWMFGGSNNNDLWKYDPSSNNWTWVSGATKAGSKGVYATRGIPDSVSEPASRGGAVGWVDEEGALVLFGGIGAGLRDDIWSYQPATGQWTWVKGSNLAGAKPFHGQQNIGAEPNTPGARQLAAVATDSNGEFWLFGGANGANNYSDLWKLDMPLVMQLRTLAASSIGDNDATLNATVDPNEVAAEAFFRYGKRLDLSDAIETAPVVIGDGTAPVALNETVTGLDEGSVYYFQVVGVNAFGQHAGAVKCFRTTGTAPAPVVQFASSASTINESVGTATVDVVLNVPAPTTITVNVGVGGTAIPASDFTAPPATVTFVPGQQIATISSTIINDNIPEVDRTITLTLSGPTGATLGGTAVHTVTLEDDDENIVVVTPPQSQFAAVGGVLNLGVVATGSGTLKYQWKFNGKNLVGATGATYSIAKMALSNAGKYSVEISNNTGKVTPEAEVFVIDTTSKSYTAAPSSSVTMSVTVAGPSAVEYKWTKVPNPTVLVAAKSMTLSFLNAGSSGTYICTVNKLGAPLVSGVSGNNVLNVFNSFPTVTPVAQLTTGAVGSDYQHQIRYAGDPFIGSTPNPLTSPQSFIVTGLPAGLKVSTTGLITGKPTKPVTNQPVTIIAKNAAGDSMAVNTVITILGVPANVQGSFVGRAERNANLGANMGARLDLTTTAAGGFTAKLLAEGVSATVKGSLVAAIDNLPSVTSMSGQADFVRKGKSTLRLQFTLNPVTNAVTGTLTDLTTSAVAAVSGFRNTWHKTTNPATGYQNGYTFALEIPAVLAGDLDLPQGNGIGAFTVAADGKLTCAGMTADGFAYTSAGHIGPMGQVVVYSSFKARAGSLEGTGTIASVGPTFENNTFSGSLTWNKAVAAATAKDQLYRSGFSPVTLAIIGGKYKAQTAGGVVAGLANANNNAKLTFNEGGLKAGDVNPYTFSITNATTGLGQKITLPLPNVNKVTFKLAAKPAGQYSGTFTVLHPTSAALNRVAKFNGMIVWTGSTYENVGFFILAQPPQSGQTTKTSTVLSGQVDLTAP